MPEQQLVSDLDTESAFVEERVLQFPKSPENTLAPVVITLRSGGRQRGYGSVGSAIIHFLEASGNLTLGQVMQTRGLFDVLLKGPLLLT